MLPAAYVKFLVTLEQAGFDAARMLMPATVCCACPHSPERREDVTHAGNYLVFGHGPHYCVGKEYAINHLITFLAILSTSLDWTRFRYAWGR